MSTGIQWTDETWNPVIGCTRVSEGCRFCYAERQAARLAEDFGVESYEGIARKTPAGPRWTGEVRFLPHKLGEPLRWTRPRRVFVNSMSDLFHSDLLFAEIAAVFGVMAAARGHTFQVLTKRPAVARDFFGWLERGLGGPSVAAQREAAQRGARIPLHPEQGTLMPQPWPLPNVWLGVSVEGPEVLRRALDLSRCPAAVRFVSYEPALASLTPQVQEFLPGLDWIIFGGESGPGARPCDVHWARDLATLCRDAEVPLFVKQLGARPKDPVTGDEGLLLDDGWLRLRHSKGGDPAEWPEDLRVRMWPGEAWS